MSENLNVTYLSTQLLRFPKRDTRFYRDRDFLRALKRSVKELGFQQPLHVQPIEGFGFELLSGGSRLIVARELKIKEVPCFIHYNLTREQFLVLRGILDMERQRYDVLAISRDMLELKQKHGWNQKRIARHYHISESWTTRLLAIWRMSPEMREQIHNYEISINDAYEDLRSRERSVAPKSDSLEPPKPKPITCYFCKREVGYFTDYRKIVICRDCLGSLPKPSTKPKRKLPPSSSTLY